MPIYEYCCVSCGEKVTLRLRQADEKGSCPACGGELKRVWSTFAVAKTEWESPFSDSQVREGLQRRDPRAFAEYGRRLAGGGPTGPEYQRFLDDLVA
jgi:putative FmdB family regulatory protein